MKFLKLLLAASMLASAGTGQASEGGGRAPEGFIQVAPISVPVLDDYRMQGRLSVTFAVKSENEKLKERFAARAPMVQEVYVRRLTEFARIWVDTRRPVNVPRLVSELQEATNEIAPHSGAKVYVLEARVDRR